MKINLKKPKKRFIAIVFAIANNVFLACLALFLIALIIGAVLLYQCTIFSESDNGQSSDILKIEKSAYDNVISIWQENDKKFEEANLKNYPNPFYFKINTSASPTVDIIR
jgi:hypothetical protein